MKKKICLFSLLTITLLLSGCGREAMAQNTREGATEELIQMRETLLPAEETFVPEDELNTLGTVAYYPNLREDSYAVAGSNCISLFFRSTQVVQQSGQIALFEKDTRKKIASLDVSDQENVILSPLSEEGKRISSFEEGTQADIYFDYAFDAGKTYFVLMDPGCFSMGRVTSKAVTDAEMINFSVKQYGFSGVMRSVYHPQEFLFFDVVLGGGTNRAEMVWNEDELSVIQPVITTESIANGEYLGKPMITFLSYGKPVLTVNYYKGEELVDTVDMTFEVVSSDIPIEGIEEAENPADEETEETKEGEGG